MWQSMTNTSQLLSACLKEVINFQFIAFDVGVCAIKITAVCVYWEKSEMWQISLNHISKGGGNKRKCKECKTTVGFILFYDSHVVSDLF